MAAGSTYGNIFKFMTWGESHGEGLRLLLIAVLREFLFVKKIYRSFLTEENQDSQSILHLGKKMIK